MRGAAGECPPYAQRHPLGFRTGSPWRDIRDRYKPSASCYFHFVRWRAAGVWDRILDAVSGADHGDLIMIEEIEMVAWDVPAAA
jgi:transposase